MSRPAVLAIDGGGSKIDAVLIDRDGAIAGSARVEPSDTDGQRAGDLAAIGLAVEAACRDARIETDDLPVARLVWTTSGSPTRPEPLHPVHRHDVRARSEQARAASLSR